MGVAAGGMTGGRAACPGGRGPALHCPNAGTKTAYNVVELALRQHGENWMRDYVEKANNGGIERVLL